MALARVGVTLGDPSGIGPEVVVKAFVRPELLPAADYVLFASPSVLDSEQAALGLSLRRGPMAFAGGREGRLTLSPREEPRLPIPKGAPCAESGRLSFKHFEAAVEAARGKKLDAIVTAPISKKSWSLAGLPWRGHTEYLDGLFPGAVMVFWSERLKVALLSHHLPLREALGIVTEESLSRFLIHLGGCFARAGLKNVEFKVAGLNPHAGEDGVLGDEEVRMIRPAVEKARRAGLAVEGPFPPDVVFRRGLNRPGTVVVALYHDQGLIAFKLLAFETGVNVSLGLPFIRTSPDHGTAFDIAGLNAADPASLVEAVRLAVGLASTAAL